MGWIIEKANPFWASDNPPSGKIQLITTFLSSADKQHQSE